MVKTSERNGLRFVFHLLVRTLCVHHIEFRSLDKVCLIRFLFISHYISCVAYDGPFAM